MPMRKLKNEELNRVSIDEFKNKKKNPLVVILDDVRSLNNVGSVFRTSDAFCVSHLYLCGITGRPPHRDINKTALGATDAVDWTYEKDILSLIRRLKSQGFKIVAIEQVDTSMALQEFSPDKSTQYAFIFGNEAFGVKEEVVGECDFCLEIPQYGTKHSLNVAVSFGVVAWDYFSKVEFSAQK